MKLFKALLIAAVGCATVAIATLITYAALGADLGDSGVVFVIGFGALALILGAASAVTAGRR